MKVSRTKYLQNFLILIVLLLIVSIVLWFQGQEFSLNKSQTLRYFGQIFGITGLVMMSLNYVFATRFRFIESLFGGLDKMYRLHMFIGIGSYILVLFHPIFLALRFLDTSSLIKNYFIPFIDSNSTEKNLGIVAFWLLTFLIFITSSKKLPYKYWRITHSFIGIPLILGGAHSLLASKSIENSPLLGIWIAAWSTIGVACYIYKVFLYEYIGPAYKYTIVDIKDFPELREFYLEPLKKKMNFQAGQFAFLKFYSKCVSTEEHPFTMSYSPTDKYLRFSIKKLGDWSSSLQNVKVGDRVKVLGPYGQFNFDFLRKCKKQIWIGGGIGITPFLSMIRYELENTTCGEIHLIYSDNIPEQAVFKDEIMKFKDRKPGLNIIIHYSDSQGYLDANKIEDWAGGLEDAVFLFCGPAAMTNSVSKQLIEDKKIPKDDIVFEYFNFK